MGTTRPPCARGTAISMEDDLKSPCDVRSTFPGENGQPRLELVISGGVRELMTNWPVKIKRISARLTKWEWGWVVFLSFSEYICSIPVEETEKIQNYIRMYVYKYIYK